MRFAACLLVLAACEQPPGPIERPIVDAKPAIALAPPPAPTITGTALSFVDRSGEVALRHGGIMEVGISRQGRFAASGSWAGSVAVWDTHDGHLARWIDTTHGNIYAVAVTDDGTRLATSGWDDTVRLWDLTNGRELWQSKQSATSLMFDPTNARLVGGRGDLYRVWNVADGRMLWEDVNRDPYNHDLPKPERAHAIADDGSTAIELVVSGRRHEQAGCVGMNVPTGYNARLHDVATGAERSVRVGGGSTQILGASPAADRLGVIDYDAMLDVFTAAGKQLAHVSVGIAAQLPPLTRLMLVDNPRYALTWSQKELAAWDLLASKQLWSSPGYLYGDPHVAAGDIVVASQAGACSARRLSDGVRLWRREQCLHVAASRSSSLVVVATGTSTLDLVDARTGSSRFATATPRPISALSELAISGDGKQVVGFAERSLWRWDTAGIHLLRSPGRVLWRPLLHFLSNGQLAVVDEVNLGTAVAYRYDLTTNAIVSTRDITLGGQIGSGRAFVGDHLIVEKVLEQNYERTRIDLLDREPPRKLPMWKRPASRPNLVMRNDNLYQAVIDPIANVAYVDGDGNVLHAWDMKTGKLLAASTETQGFTRPLALTPDRKHVIVPQELDSSSVVSLRQGKLVVHDTAKLAKERELGPTGYPTAAAVSPDGTLVVAAALDGLFVWRLADGKQLARVNFSGTHEAPVSLAFTADGTSLWVGTDIGTLLHFAVSYSENRAP